MKQEDYHELIKRMETGLITMRKHPVLDMEICNYTSKTQYNKMWDSWILEESIAAHATYGGQFAGSGTLDYIEGKEESELYQTKRPAHGFFGDRISREDEARMTSSEGNRVTDLATGCDIKTSL